MRSIHVHLALLACGGLMFTPFACTSQSNDPDQPAELAGSAAGGGGLFGAAGMSSAGSAAAGTMALAGSGGMLGVAGTTATAGSGPAAGSGGSGTAGATAGTGSADTDASVDAATNDDAGTAAYDPCPASGDPCKILPLGDSITFGIQQEGAYRIELFRQSVLADQNITFVGSQMNGPSMVENVPFPRNHEGYSGFTVAQIDQQVVDNALGFDPNIITLMIGTNDMYQDAGGAPDRLEGLIDKIIAMKPDALLVLAQLTPAQGFQSAIDTYNAALPAIVQERADAGKHILLVDMSDTEISGDGIHPDAAGYTHMGEVWYAAIKDVLPANN